MTTHRRWGHYDILIEGSCVLSFHEGKIATKIAFFPAMHQHLRPALGGV